MGLSIHYALQSVAPTARQQVEQLQQAALSLPFEFVGDIVELTGDQIDVDPADDEVRSWLIVQAGRWLRIGEAYAHVKPQHVIAFPTWPGSGCEAANFGLCRYPSEAIIDGRSLPTGLSGWSWQSSCKTQYASNPEDGGTANFLRCHLAIVRLLDHARDLDLLDQVQDEGRFWDNRSAPALVEAVGQWNRQLAAFVGRFKDEHGGEFAAPIAEFPNFEHLEAEGRDAEA